MTDRYHEIDGELDRTTGIGGSDIGAIMGINPWCSPLDVYLRKVGITAEEPENEAMWWGTELEPVILRRYCEQNQRKLAPFCHPARMIDPDWAYASPDGLIVDVGHVTHPLWGVEVKTAGATMSREWGEEDEEPPRIPPHYEYQCRWGMWVLGLERWDIAVLIGGNTYRQYTLTWDETDQDIMIEDAIDFWENHVLPRIPPEPTGHPAEAHALQSLHPEHDDDVVAVGAEVEELALAYKAAQDQRDVALATYDALQNRLKAVIGDHAGVTGPWGTITWKSTKTGSRRFVAKWESD